MRTFSINRLTYWHENDIQMTTNIILIIIRRTSMISIITISIIIKKITTKTVTINLSLALPLNVGLNPNSNHNHHGSNLIPNSQRLCPDHLYGCSRAFAIWNERRQGGVREVKMVLGSLVLQFDFFSNYFICLFIYLF